MTMQFKSIPLDGVQLKLDGETRRFKGYASTFNGNDEYGDTILPGAYAKTLKDFGLPKMFFGHKWDLPIGKWVSAEQDEKGLLVEGELTAGNPQADAVLAALKHGTVDGLSIGFRLKSGDYDEKQGGGRLIKSVSRLFEISIVSFPADGNARVTEVRSEDINDIKTIRDFECFLRDAGGFSRSTAAAIVAKAKQLTKAQGDPDADEKAAQQILERINALAEKM